MRLKAIFVFFVMAMASVGSMLIVCPEWADTSWNRKCQAIENNECADFLYGMMLTASVMVLVCAGCGRRNDEYVRYIKKNK